MIAPGGLYVVATPIGNLGDMSRRALAVLAQVDIIACEDTRSTRVLLDHYGIQTPTLALHDHNELAQTGPLLARLRSGDAVALVSDAGTPLISDPGYRLVAAARNAGLAVHPIPGACAAIAALSAAGLASDRFCFEGFLPPKPAARRARLAQLAGEPRTLILYESSHRIVDTLADLVAAFGAARPAVLARELTKRFETFLGPDLAGIAASLAADRDQRRGEFVLVIAGNPDPDAAALALGRRIHAALAGELSPSRAARIAAEISGASRRALYAGRDGSADADADADRVAET
ncbi:MAG: 16S rRNA (cytidine(1402)-2'-O)-methyltransferase [Xanthomonadales bacterium]|nr:16S rRNA (cytidine(1402)-2'-O)-methyltransferase [Xanthomonadales bacterium]